MKSKSKTGIRQIIFLPAALMLVLLPVAAYLAFATFSDSYMKKCAEERTDSFISDIGPEADRIFSDSGSGLSQTEVRAQASAFLALLRDGNYAANRDVYVAVLGSETQVSFPRDTEYYADFDDIYALCAELISSDTSNEIKKDAVLNGGRYHIVIKQLNSNVHTRARYLIGYSRIQDTSELTAGAGRLILCISAVLALVYILVAWLTSQRISGAVKGLCRYAEQIGDGCFEPHQDTSAIREFGELHRSMERMADQLDSARKKQNTFFQNVSHELRTPLMSIGGYAQGIRCGIIEDTSHSAEIIETECVRLTELVNGILELSRLDSAASDNDEKYEIDLAEYLEQTLTHITGMADARKIKISLADSSDGKARVLANGRLLNHAFTNIISNGVRYAHSTVCVELVTEQQNAVIRVSDDGDGISDTDIEHIFERFYKGRGGNSGIGLSLALASAEHMNGTIRARNKLPPESGAIFELIIPLLHQASR